MYKFPEKFHCGSFKRNISHNTTPLPSMLVNPRKVTCVLTILYKCNSTDQASPYIFFFYQIETNKNWQGLWSTPPPQGNSTKCVVKRKKIIPVWSLRCKKKCWIEKLENMWKSWISIYCKTAKTKQNKKPVYMSKTTVIVPNLQFFKKLELEYCTCIA